MAAFREADCQYRTTKIDQERNRFRESSMHCKLDPLVCLTTRPIIPLRHEVELRPASYTQVYRRKKLRGAYSDACCGGWGVCC